MSIIEWGTDLILDIIRALWYPGIIFLMALESACMPVPSEIVMPFAGALVRTDSNFTILGVTAAGTIGNILGSIIAYWVGMKAGRPLILKYGKFVLIREKHLDWAERWFARYGDPAIFFSRMMPIIRTFISLPAGMARMNFGKFVILTTLGSIPWNFALTYVGYMLGGEWEDIQEIFHKFDLVIVAAIIIVAIIFIWKYLKNSDRRDRNGNEEKSEPCSPCKAQESE